MRAGRGAAVQGVEGWEAETGINTPPQAAFSSPSCSQLHVVEIAQPFPCLCSLPGCVTSTASPFTHRFLSCFFFDIRALGNPGIKEKDSCFHLVHFIHLSSFCLLHFTYALPPCEKCWVEQEQKNTGRGKIEKMFCSEH